MQRDHGGAGADLRLLGVFGPLPLDSVVAAGLEPDGRLRVDARSAPRRGGRATSPSRATLATQRLVRTDVPYPGPGGSGRALR